MSKQSDKDLSLLFPQSGNANELIGQLPDDFSPIDNLTKQYSDLVQLTRNRMHARNIPLTDDQLSLFSSMGLIAAAMDYNIGKEKLSFRDLAEPFMRTWVLIAVQYPEIDLKSEFILKIQRWGKGDA